MWDPYTLCADREYTLSPSRSTCGYMDTMKVVLVQSLDEDLAAIFSSPQAKMKVGGSLGATG
jgi:hypothetical protein